MGKKKEKIPLPALLGGAAGGSRAGAAPQLCQVSAPHSSAAADTAAPLWFLSECSINALSASLRSSRSSKLPLPLQNFLFAFPILFASGIVGRNSVQEL